VASAAALCTLVSAPAAEAFTPTGRTIAAGTHFSLALGANGVAVGFGRNSSGQLANSTNNGTDNPNPVPSAIGPSNLVAVAAGETWGVGLDNFGRVWTFGNNRYGQLGRAANVDTDIANPVSTMVVGLDHVTAIAAGQSHTLVLRSDGTVWGFGTNNAGELGTAVSIGSRTTTPLQIPGLSNIISIAAGWDHTLALGADGNVWALGYNYFGQLGNTINNNSANANSTPTKISSLTSVTAIAAGANYSLALTSDGGVWAFGSNSNGELGKTANFAANPSPTRVLGISKAIAISAEGHHSLVLLATRTVVAFGPNIYGQLGTATNSGTGTPTAPTAVTGLTNVTAIAAGAEHSLAVRADGSVVAFGHNTFGQLGFAADGIPHPAATQVIASGIGQPPSFAPLVPARLLDTRPGGATIDGIDDGGDVRDADSTTALQVAGRGGVQLDATSVALNVTVTGAAGTGFITVYPCGTTQPNASSINYTAGSTIANAVIAKVSTSGNVCLYTSAATQLIVDVNGYFRDSTAFGSLEPARLLDTRPDSLTVDGLYENFGLAEADSVTEVSITTRGNVPPTATAVALNVTVNEAKGTGFVTVYPCGSPRPNASNLNYVAGTTIANAVVVKIGVAGNVCFYTSAATHLIVDVNAFFRNTDSSASVVPARLLDSRPTASTIDGASAGIGLRPGDSVTELQVFGRGGVPGGATAVILNVTVTEPQGNAFVTVFPCGSPRPNASNVNYTTGLTIPNLVIAKVGDDGKVCLYSLAATHLIADVNAYYS
jgi:alpha-tubulin suppressor-like RCC1 family protein